MKKRTITLMLSLLAVALLVGVGFATWVITQSASDDFEGNLVVDTVKDNRLNVSVAIKEGDSASFNFTGKADANVSNPWLTNPENPNAEDKSMTLVVTITKKDGLAFNSAELPSVTWSIAAANDHISKEGLISLVSDGATIAATSANLSADEKTVTLEFTVEYQWGYVFNEQNPFTYFNGHGVNEALTATEVANAGSEKANLTYGTPAAALTTANTFADLAHAALEALYAQNAQTVTVDVTVTL